MEAVTLSQVLARPDVWRGDHLADDSLPAIASGFAALDAALPGGGWPRGALTELLGDSLGCGETSLLLPALARLCTDDGWLLLVAPPHSLQAAALAQAGINLARLLVVTPRPGRDGAGDALWAARQGLASNAPAAVLCWSASADAPAVRRLQVAASASRSLLFLFRPARAAQAASAAPLRLQLTAGTEGALTVHILKRRGPPLSHPLHLAVPRPARWCAPHGNLHGNSHDLPLARPASAPALPRRLSNLPSRPGPADRLAVVSA